MRTLDLELEDLVEVEMDQDMLLVRVAAVIPAVVVVEIRLQVLVAEAVHLIQEPIR